MRSYGYVVKTSVGEEFVAIDMASGGYPYLTDTLGQAKIYRAFADAKKDADFMNRSGNREVGVYDLRVDLAKLY